MEEFQGDVILDDNHAITHFMAGKQNRHSPYPNKTTRDGMSHLWRGPSFYTRYLTRYTLPEESLNPAALPSDVAEMATIPPTRGPIRVPAGTQALSPGDAWNRRWSGAGLYSPNLHNWTRELVNVGVPNDSRLFINEDDWRKYKFMCSHPTLPASVPDSSRPPTGCMPASGAERQYTKPITYEESLKYYMS